MYFITVSFTTANGFFHTVFVSCCSPSLQLFARKFRHRARSGVCRKSTKTNVKLRAETTLCHSIDSHLLSTLAHQNKQSHTCKDDDPRQNNKAQFIPPKLPYLGVNQHFECDFNVIFVPGFAASVRCSAVPLVISSLCQVSIKGKLLRRQFQNIPNTFPPGGILVTQSRKAFPDPCPTPNCLKPIVRWNFCASPRFEDNAPDTLRKIF